VAVGDRRSRRMKVAMSTTQATCPTLSRSPHDRVMRATLDRFRPEAIVGGSWTILAGGRLGSGQREVKGTAAPLLAFHPDPAVVDVDDALGDIKAQPQSTTVLGIDPSKSL